MASTTAGLVGLEGRELAKSLEAVGLGGSITGHACALGGDGAVASGGQAFLNADAAVVHEGGDEETAEGMAGDVEPKPLGGLLHEGADGVMAKGLVGGELGVGPAQGGEVGNLLGRGGLAIQAGLTRGEVTQVTDDEGGGGLVADDRKAHVVGLTSDGVVEADLVGLVLEIGKGDVLAPVILMASLTDDAALNVADAHVGMLLVATGAEEASDDNEAFHDEIHGDSLVEFVKVELVGSVNLLDLLLVATSAVDLCICMFTQNMNTLLDCAIYQINISKKNTNDSM